MDRCVIRVGRIIDHPCGRKAMRSCSSCGKKICRHHLADGRCVMCAGSWVEPTARLRLEELDLDKHFSGLDEAFGVRAGRPDSDLHGLDS